MIPHEVLIDTLVEARLETFQIAERDVRPDAPSWARATRVRPRPWEERPLPTEAGPSVRVRIGHGLAALGAAIAGEDKPKHAQRAA